MGAFAADYAAYCFSEDFASAASVLIAAEKEHRKDMIYLGRAISQPKPVAVQMLAEQLVAILPDFLGEPVSEGDAVDLIKTAIFSSMGICDDYKDEIDKTIEILASMGDSLNNATIKTIGPTPFDAPVVLIFTPDQETDARVRGALKRAGYPEAIINTLVYPASILNLGYGEGADEFRILSRSGIWEDEKAGKTYIENPPMSLFRVTPRISAGSALFPVPDLRIRGTGRTEMDLMNTLEQLREGIIAAHPGMVAIDIQISVPVNEGYHYIQRGVDPWGDSRDAFFILGGYTSHLS